MQAILLTAMLVSGQAAHLNPRWIETEPLTVCDQCEMPDEDCACECDEFLGRARPELGWFQRVTSRYTIRRAVHFARPTNFRVEMDYPWHASRYDCWLERHGMVPELRGIREPQPIEEVRPMNRDAEMMPPPMTHDSAMMQVQPAHFLDEHSSRKHRVLRVPTLEEQW